jgi:hypothetical protein
LFQEFIDFLDKIVFALFKNDPILVERRVKKNEKHPPLFGENILQLLKIIY